VQYVDEIIPYEWEHDLEDILQSYPINVRILGEEYRDRQFTGKSFCETNGIELYYNKRKHRFSSSELRDRIDSKEYLTEG
jgi:glycerol-3-phosphate cytidylyltransferase